VTAPPDIAIDVEGLTKSFDGRTVVRNLSMRVKRGTIYGFLGPNGSGKTTTIRMLCGLLTPDQGRGTCLGFDIITQSDQIKHYVGYMTQRFSLYQDLSVRENLEFVARLYGLRNPVKAARAMIERIGLAGREEQLAAELSGGWKQRLALGACTLPNPQLLLLDEPTAGVDPKARRDFWDQIHQLAAEGLTFLITTHYMDEAERCSHVAYIYFGKIIADGTPDALRELPDVQPEGTQRVEITTHEVTRALRIVREIRGVRSATIFGQSVHALIEERLNPEDLRAQLLKNGIVAGEIRPLSASLEDVFVQLTYKHQALQEAVRE
jgi:ABC-2 type transport system ATP-binding protein